MAKVSNQPLSMKRIGVNKTNGRIVAITSGAAFLVVFFLVASWSLMGQLNYQNRVIGARKQAVDQLKKNLSARDSLVKSYSSFAEAGQNFIGGSATGAGAQDGTNPKLVLDALPGKYDFPALTSSLEKVSQEQKVAIESVGGVDDEIAQTGSTDADPKPVEMPFEFKVAGDYVAVQRTVDAFDRSIRPIKIQKVQISGDAEKTTLFITASSYYQPTKALTIKTKVVK